MSINILNRYTGSVLATIPGSTLAGVDFGGMNLTNADLSNQDLTASKFTGANISGSTLQNSNCSSTIFFRSNVKGCDFRGITTNASSDFRCGFFESILVDPGVKPVLVHFQGGQSNDVSTAAGATTGLPDSSIPFYFNQIGTYDSGGFIPLQINPNSGNHGAEIIYAQEMKAAGYDIVIVKLDRGATTQSDWVPGAPDFTALQTSFLNAISLLLGLYPGRFFQFLGSWYLGEDDARSSNAGSAIYGPNFILFQNGIEVIIAQSMWKKFHIVLTPLWLAGAAPNSLYNCRYWQQLLAGWNNSVEDLPRQGDDVHLTAAGEDTLGHRRYLSVMQQLAGGFFQ